MVFISVANSKVVHAEFFPVEQRFSGERHGLYSTPTTDKKELQVFDM
jgi:hypothetical protein